MVVHEAIGMTEPMIPMVDFAEDEEKILPVLIVTEYPLTLVAPAGHVIYSSGVFYAQWSRHRRTLPHQQAYVKKRDLTPFTFTFISFIP